MRNTPSDQAAGGIAGGWNANELIGTQLGSCILERPLGVGGMGAVFLARQTRPKRQVAVKLIRPLLSTDPGAWRVFMERFRREADATAALDHANIVPIYEFGEDGSMAYLVMPFLPDGSLAAQLSREGRLPLRQVLSYLDQTAAALDCAHRNHIIHRDVKPSNLLLHPDGRVMLADFGIARLLQRRDTPLPMNGTTMGDGSLTMVGVAMGTPEYMAPELIRGEPVTPLVDIYSLATVGYAMLAGRTPFGGGDVNAILGRQVHETPPPLRALAPETPPEIERVITWALAKSPADRPQSAQEFALALRGAAERLGMPAGTGAYAIAGSVGAFGEPGGNSQGRGTRARHTQAMTPMARFATSAPGSDETLFDPAIATGPRRAPGGRGGGMAGGMAGGMGGGTGGAVPVWPGASAKPEPRGRGKRMGPLPLLGLAAALVVLLVMAIVVGSAVGSAINPSVGPATGLTGIAATQTAKAAQPTATSLPSPTPTIPPTVTPIPPTPADWLNVAPGSISLGCHGTNTSADITLTNQGTDSVDWTASTQSGFFQNDGISLSDTQGTLDPGENATITVTNTSIFQKHKGAITFTANSDQAGNPVTVHYTTQACH